MLGGERLPFAPLLPAFALVGVAFVPLFGDFADVLVLPFLSVAFAFDCDSGDAGADRVGEAGAGGGSVATGGGATGMISAALMLEMCSRLAMDCLGGQRLLRLYAKLTA